VRAELPTDTPVESVIKRVTEVPGSQKPVDAVPCDQGNSPAAMLTTQVKGLDWRSVLRVSRAAALGCPPGTTALKREHWFCLTVGKRKGLRHGKSSEWRAWVNRSRKHAKLGVCTPEKRAHRCAEVGRDVHTHDDDKTRLGPHKDARNVAGTDLQDVRRSSSTPGHGDRFCAALADCARRDRSISSRH